MTTDYLIAVLQTHFEKIAVQELQPVKVAVIDSGIDASHPDLKNRVFEAYRVEMQKGSPVIVQVDNNKNNDANGHGTAVASIISSIAPNARIIDIRVLESDNFGTGIVLVRGLQYAIERNSKVINMSLAATEKFSNDLFKLCEAAYYNDQIVVASKRNMPMGDVGYPAEFSCCIGVDMDNFSFPDTLKYKTDKLIENAAHKEKDTVAAAGGGYTTMSGTSFTAPNISALCALLVGYYPKLRPFEVKTILNAFTTDKVI